MLINIYIYIHISNISIVERNPWRCPDFPKPRAEGVHSAVPTRDTSKTNHRGEDRCGGNNDKSGGNVVLN